jgi:long-chain fatty acid transport protein
LCHNARAMRLRDWLCPCTTAFVIAVTGTGRPCRASSVLETVGAPGVGNGLSARVLARGTEATYYNPALLPDVEADLSFGVLLIGEWSRIHLAPRPSGVDVPDSVYAADLVRSATNGNAFWPQPTSQLLHARSDTVVREATPYLALGIVRPLLGKALVFGFYALVPMQGFLRQDSFFSDEREQYFSNQLHEELLGDRLKVSSLSAALGGRIVREVSWGVGLDLGMATRTHMQVYIPDAADQRTLLMVPQIETSLAIAPYVALAVRPSRTWFVVSTVHLPKSWDTSGENRLRYWDYTYENGQSAVVQSYYLTQGSEPLRVGLGAGTRGKLGKLDWELGIQGLWTQWAQYRDRHDDRPLDPWHNTVNLGLGWSLTRSEHRFAAELGVIPSPVPDQTGRTNYVDDTRLCGSLGYEIPLRYREAKYSLGLYAQAQFLVPRSVTKQSTANNPVIDEVPDGAVDRVHALPLPGATGLQTNNPGYPGFSSSGTLLGAALVLKAMP